MMQLMQGILETLGKIVYGIGFRDVIDIAIVAFVVYKILGFIRESRAEQLVKGLLVLVVATFLSDKLGLMTVYWILEATMTLGVFALFIVFQPELRRALEYVGRSKFLRTQFGAIDKEKAKELTSQIIKAIDFFSNNKVGALIVLEKETVLSDIAETGTKLDAAISRELLGNIFYEGAPLHDGAAILRGDRILAAGCVLPLSQNRTLSKDLGTRHRAGLGITESSDSIALIVSEETGIISIASDGLLTRFLDIKAVEKALLNLYMSQLPDDKKKNPLKSLVGRWKKDEK